MDIYCDSTYVIGVLSKGWKAKANWSLIAQIKALMPEFKDLRLLKVNAHTGVPPNEFVDKLAKEAIRTKQGLVMERRSTHVDKRFLPGVRIRRLLPPCIRGHY